MNIKKTLSLWVIMSKGTDLHSVPVGGESVSSEAENRIWKTLETMSASIGRMETMLVKVVRLEEKVNSHKNAIDRFGNRLDKHDDRMRDVEIWQANQNDRESLERLLEHIQESIHNYSSAYNKDRDITAIEIDKINKRLDITKGQRDTEKSGLKWLAGILAGIVIYVLTKV